MLSYRIDQDLELALPRIKDARALYIAIDSSRASLRTYLPWVDDVLCPDDEIPSIQADRHGFANDESLNLLIWYQGQIAGKISFNKFDQLNDAADIGYWLAEDFRGLGLMSRSLEKIFEIGFEEYGLHRIYLCCATDNLKSNRVAQRAGMRLESTQKQCLKLADGYHDQNEYALLRAEWDARQKNTD